MSPHYKATPKQNPGRKGWLIEFRHPLRKDTNGKPGRKIRKGLGTDDATEAERLAEQLTELLANESLWSVGGKAEAERRFDPKVIEVFYDEFTGAEAQLGPAVVRDKFLTMPTANEGYAKVALMGVPGAGKTTLMRQLMGTDPEKERFPSTSVNRTTTFPTEVILRADGAYEAAVTFMSEHQVRFSVEECLSSAIVAAVDGERAKVATALLEKSDMRFRLKYLLGDFTQEDDSDFDPYETSIASPTGDSDSMASVSDAEKAQFESRLLSYLERIEALTDRLLTKVEQEMGAISSMAPEDRSAALDLIEEEATTTDEFVELVADILEEIKTKFGLVAEGRFEKTTTGWPKVWHVQKNADERDGFIRVLRLFSGIAVQSWGKLLTPLVDGLRVTGPFKPKWATETPRLVLVDTEGLGHKAGSTADLPESVLSLLHESDVILLVDSAKNGMTNFATGKALEAVTNAGHTRKLAVVFTHMDEVKGDNLKGRAKLDHVFGGLRNVVENQLAKNVSTEAARYLLDHLRDQATPNTFYVGAVDRGDPQPAIPQLQAMLARLCRGQPAVFEPMAFPEYSADNLVLAIREAAKDFRELWQGLLGLIAHHEHKPVHWQKVKAMSRRYAENWGDDYELQPTANLLASLSAAASRFLESPINWSGNPTPEEKRETIDSLKTAVTKQLQILSRRRLRDDQRQHWYDAYVVRGKGSARLRQLEIENIYEIGVPVPDSRGDRQVNEFMNEVKNIVLQAIKTVEADVKQRAEAKPAA